MSEGLRYICACVFIGWFLTSKINAVLMILVEVSVSIRERVLCEKLYLWGQHKWNNSINTNNVD